MWLCDTILAKEMGVEAVVEAVLFSPSVMSDFLRPHALQHTRLPCLRCLREFAQTYVHWVGDAIQPSHPPSPPSPPAFNLSRHQGLLQWVSSLHQVAKVLELQLKHQSLQCTEKKKAKGKQAARDCFSLFLLPHFLLLPAGNINVMAGSSAAPLDHEQHGDGSHPLWTAEQMDRVTINGSTYQFWTSYLQTFFYHQIWRRMRIIIKLILSYHRYRLY